MTGIGALRALLAALTVTLTLVSAFVAGAAERPAVGAAKLEVVTSDGMRHAFAVEYARTAEDLARGLMFRRHLDRDAGMLFDFGKDLAVSMWMKNTYIPLDMIFIDAAGQVTGIAERTVPLSLEVISSPGPVRAVLEVNSGTSARLGIRPGDRVLHPMFISRPH